MSQNVLSPTMTLREFENGYWYLDQLKKFAERIGLPAARKLRKDELEIAIMAFLRTGHAELLVKRPLRKTGAKDIERGINLNLPIERFRSNAKQSDFIVEQARGGADIQKSGSDRLNRWGRTRSQAEVFYVRRLRPAVHCPERMERFEKIPHGRYIHFVAEFLAAEKGSTRAEAIAAWIEIKKLDVPKDYASWVTSKRKRNGKIN